jgi:hypothetical protein
MRAILNSLGVTLWLSTAIILAAGIAMVGYRGLRSSQSIDALFSEGSPRQPANGADARRAPHASSPRVSASIGKEMKAAQDALQKSQWQEALKNLDAASQKSGITAFDKFKIADFRLYADIKLQHYKEAQGDVEAALATGQYSSEETAKNKKILFQLAAQNQNYPKAIEVGRQLADQGQLTPNDLTFMAQLYYVQKDCKNATVWAGESIAAYNELGEAPKEQPYQFQLQCASDAGDMAGMEGPLMDLVRLTNKATYWNDLLRIERQKERDDHNLLMIYRIMYNTGSMKEGSDYLEMAFLLSDAGLPGEGAAVLDKALVQGLIKLEQQERAERLAKSLRNRADDGEKDLSRLELEAARSPSGNASIILGMTYYGMADYQSAADSIQQGLRKGNLTRADDAYVYLGLADRHLGDIQGAQQSFASLQRVPNLSPRVLKLWQLYSSRHVQSSLPALGNGSSSPVSSDVATTEALPESSAGR